MTLQHLGTSNLYDNNVTTRHKPHYPFEIPDSWEWTTIGEIASTILYGVSESAKESGKFKLLRITDIQNNRVNWQTVPFTNYDEIKAAAYLLKDGDILFARTGATVGKSYLVEGLSEPSIYASYLIRVQTSTAIIPTYTKFFFESGFYWEQISLNSVGVGQPNVNGTTLASLLMPIPPYQEQKRIVEESKKWLSVIDGLDIELEGLVKSIDVIKSKILDLAINGKLVQQDPADEPAADLLKRVNPNAVVSTDKSHYIIPSSWVWVKLEDIFEINPKNHNNDDDECGFVPMANVQDGYSGKHTFEVRKWREVKKGYCHFQNGDIAVAKISPCFENLKSVIMRSLPNNIGAGTTELVILRSKEVFAPYFLYLFKSPWYISKGSVYFKGVVGQQRVSRDIFTKLAVPMPPLNEQKRIVAKVDELFALIDTIQQSLE